MITLVYRTVPPSVLLRPDSPTGRLLVPVVSPRIALCLSLRWGRRGVPLPLILPVAALQRAEIAGPVAVSMLGIDIPLLLGALAAPLLFG